MEATLTEDAFWSSADLLASLPGFQVRSLERRASDSMRVEFSATEGTRRELVLHARYGEPQRNELSVGGLSIRYELRGPPMPSLGPQLVSWLGELLHRWPTLMSLPTARPISSLGVGSFGPVAAGAFAGWELARLEHSASGEVLFEFGSRATEARALFTLRGDELRARHRTPAPIALQEALRVVLAELLGKRTSPLGGASQHVAVKRSLEVLTAPSAPQGDEVRLVLNGPCLQHCAFCSIPDTFLPSDEGESELAGHRDVLALRSAQGIRRLRLTGVDPLASSFVIDLVRYAAELGYEHVTINSPSTRLADPVFLEALIAALPAGRNFIVPLYGVDPIVHDRVVGRPGAHALVRAALDHLFARVSRREVSLSTVLTPEVVGEMGALSRFAREEGIALNVYLPFPDADSPLDRFQRVTTPQSEIVSALLRAEALSVEELFRVRGLSPCVVLAALGPEQRARARVFLQGPEGKTPSRDGARTDHDACAHREACALVPPCDGTILRAYARRHGTAEFVPVSP